jgi:outer membrane biosynthesis protein TonB
MDKQTAKSKLKELRDSLSQVLDGKEYQSADEIKEQSKEAIQQARSASKQLKKSLLEKIKDLPVVQKVSELGTAGSVAVSTAAVAQTTVAIDQTEVFVASVANDIVEERIEAPMFIDTFIDFHELNDWGQVVMQEKVEAAQEFVEKAEAIAAPSLLQSGNSESEDPKPPSSDTKPSSEKSDDQSSQKPTENKSEEESEKEAKVEEKDSSKEAKEDDSEKGKEDKQQQDPEQKTEDKKESQEKESSSETSTDSDDVKDLPIVETPFDNDPSVRSVSPTT